MAKNSSQKRILKIRKNDNEFYSNVKLIVRNGDKYNKALWGYENRQISSEELVSISSLDNIEADIIFNMIYLINKDYINQKRLLFNTHLPPLKANKRKDNKTHTLVHQLITRDISLFIGDYLRVKHGINTNTEKLKKGALIHDYYETCKHLIPNNTMPSGFEKYWIYSIMLDGAVKKENIFDDSRINTIAKIMQISDYGTIEDHLFIFGDNIHNGLTKPPNINNHDFTLKHGIKPEIHGILAYGEIPREVTYLMKTFHNDLIRDYDMNMTTVLNEVVNTLFLHTKYREQIKQEYDKVFQKVNLHKNLDIF